MIAGKTDQEYSKQNHTHTHTNTHVCMDTNVWFKLGKNIIIILFCILLLQVLMHAFVCTYRFGPLINHWTARFEAKHKYFKHLANVIGNFANVCYSLTLRH